MDGLALPSSADGCRPHEDCEPGAAGWQVRRSLVRPGGSIPIVGTLAENMGIPSVLMGFGLPDDNLHSPNEKFHLPNFYRGIDAVVRHLEKLG